MHKHCWYSVWVQVISWCNCDNTHCGLTFRGVAGGGRSRGSRDPPYLRGIPFLFLRKNVKKIDKPNSKLNSKIHCLWMTISRPSYMQIFRKNHRMKVFNLFNFVFVSKIFRPWFLYRKKIAKAFGFAGLCLLLLPKLQLLIRKKKVFFSISQLGWPSVPWVWNGASYPSLLKLVLTPLRSSIRFLCMDEYN